MFNDELRERLRLTMVDLRQVESELSELKRAQANFKVCSCGVVYSAVKDNMYSIMCGDTTLGVCPICRPAKRKERDAINWAKAYPDAVQRCMEQHPPVGGHTFARWIMDDMVPTQITTKKPVKKAPKKGKR